LIRAPDIVVGGLRFYRNSSFFFCLLFVCFFLSSATLRAGWTELNHNRQYAPKWVRFGSARPKSGVSPPLKSGTPKPRFIQRLRSLTANLTACIFRTKHDVCNRQVCWKLQGISYVVSKCNIHKQLKIGPEFLPIYTA